MNIDDVTRHQQFDVGQDNCKCSLTCCKCCCSRDVRVQHFQTPDWPGNLAAPTFGLVGKRIGYGDYSTHVVLTAGQVFYKQPT